MSSVKIIRVLLSNLYEGMEGKVLMVSIYYLHLKCLPKSNRAVTFSSIPLLFYHGSDISSNQLQFRISFLSLVDRRACHRRFRQLDVSTLAVALLLLPAAHLKINNLATM